MALKCLSASLDICHWTLCLLRTTDVSNWNHEGFSTFSWSRSLDTACRIQNVPSFLINFSFI